ncbi:hypothetical protein R5R35_007328 [Gryllus longicercus]|uniref:Chromo domain-containing protein n=1 Tax=Gryllus longicercus TaxID=2509291 RepID=A0AAN9VWH4_9ORTH
MEVDGGDPSSVNKNPKVIKGAQEDAAKLDILVCGTCRNVFHFIEEFKEHKQEACPTSSFSAQETKPQVWAFLLWKSAIVNKDRGDGGPGNISSWKMYQRWCKMDEEIRDNWIAAGRALQSFSMIASAKLQEIRTPNDGKIRNANTRPGEESDGKDEMHDQKKGTTRTASTEKNNSESWNNTSSEDNVTKTITLNTSITDKCASGGEDNRENHDGKKASSTVSDENDSNKKVSLENDDTIEIKEEKLSEEEGSRGAWDVEDMDESAEILSAPIEIQVAKKRSEPRPDSNKVTRRSLNRSLNDGSSEDEYVVEKILAKRFNPKKKYYEYLLKWEGYPHEQNTWEPVHNMAACDKLVETFERNLAKQKAAQQAQQAQMQAQKVVSNAQSLTRKLAGSSGRDQGLEPGPSGVESGRPVRSSKKKALEQVKSWCGSMAKTTEFGKRKVGESSDSDEDELSEKKVKLEPPDDDDHWSSGEMQGSSGEENVVAIQGNQAKVVGVIHKAKEHLFAPVVKRSPGRPRKIRAEEGNAINGMKPRKEDASELAVKLGLESDSSPESKARSPQQGNKVAGQPPVLVANSKGVIKVDPRQVPNLTSGVYIVANKSNVVKLESLPGSPPKGKVLSSKTPPGKPLETNVKPGVTSGIVRKTNTGQGSVPTRLRPLAPAPPPVKLLPKPAPGQLAGVLLGGPGLMKVAPQLAQRTVVSTSPRSVTTTPRILGPRPTAILQPRGTLLQSPLRSQTPIAPGVKRPIGIPGIQTKITSAVRPRLPAAGKVVSPLTAQTKSGVKPIHAMLGKAVQGQTLATSGLLTAKKNGEGTLKPGERLTVATVKPGVRVEEERPRKGVGRGRGRGSSLGLGNDLIGKGPGKLNENDGLHMEFHEVSSSDSDSGDSLPELPMGDLPSLEPESPPRPFTLCPETGKILGRAEGEPSPPPSPVQPPPTPASVPSVPVPTSGPTPTQLSKDEISGPAPGANESEEILPDKRESSPVPYPEGNETLLKVEMSPGGTTGTVIESSVTDSQYMDTLRTEQGVTVTKIPAELGAKTAEQTINTAPRAASPTAGKASGGISVPARKLFMEGGKLNPTEVVTVTGEDGVVYQIATEGQDEMEGGEGMQQCVYVTTDQAEGSEEGAVLTLDTAVAEAVAQLMPDQVNVIGGGCSQFYIKEGEGNPVPADNNEQLVMASVVDQPGADDNAQVVAHVVQEGEIIPGTGKRRVVLLLPDGNLMMTDVDEEQYAALNLDK